MSHTQKLIYAFIKSFIKKHGFVPSYREIGAGVGLKSPASVMYQLHQLAAQGKIRIHEGRQRAITLLEEVA